MAWDTTLFSGAPIDFRAGMDTSQWSVATGGATAAGGSRQGQPSALGSLVPMDVAQATYGGAYGGGGTNAAPMLLLLAGGAVLLLVLLKHRKKG